jgi:hypothetical protein
MMNCDHNISNQAHFSSRLKSGAFCQLLLLRFPITPIFTYQPIKCSSNIIFLFAYGWEGGVSPFHQARRQGNQAGLTLLVQSWAYSTENRK